MELLKKRSVAVTIAIVVICLSTLFSVHRTLGSETKKVVDSFYTGVEETDWNTTKPAINTQLNSRADAANGAITICGSYTELDAETDALRDAREELVEADDISTKYQANKELSAAYSELLDALEFTQLTQREDQAMEEYSKTMRGAQTLIDSSGYNELVREFDRSTLGVFPANILKSAAFIKDPPLFE